jgi:hypothetical protein
MALLTSPSVNTLQEQTIIKTPRIIGADPDNPGDFGTQNKSPRLDAF